MAKAANPSGTEILAYILDGLPGYTLQPHARGKRLLQGDGTTTIVEAYSHWSRGRAFYLETTFDYSTGRAKEVFDQIPRSIHRTQDSETIGISYSTAWFGDLGLEGMPLTSDKWSELRQEIHKALDRVSSVPKLTRLGRSAQGHGWRPAIFLPLFYVTGMAIMNQPVPAQQLAAFRRRRHYEQDDPLLAMVDQIIKACGLEVVEE